MKCPICDHDTPHTFAPDHGGLICEAGSCDCRREWKLRAKSLILQRDAASEKSAEYERDALELRWLWSVVRSGRSMMSVLFDRHGLRQETLSIITTCWEQARCAHNQSVPGSPGSGWQERGFSPNPAIDPQYAPAPCGYLPPYGWQSRYARDSHRDSCGRCADAEADAIRSAKSAESPQVPDAQRLRDALLSIKLAIGTPGKGFAGLGERTIADICDKALAESYTSHPESYIGGKEVH